MKEIDVDFKFKKKDFLFGYGALLLSIVIFILLWEQHILEFTIEMAKSNNGPIFDVGANVGYHSIIWDKICKNKLIVAL